jgi:hypothetical protein
VHWAPGIPHALVFQGGDFMHNSGASRRGNAELYLDVIARSQRVRPSAGPMINSAMKQSILSSCGEMDCFAEPVIGRAFARPVGSQ